MTTRQVKAVADAIFKAYKFHESMNYDVLAQAAIEAYEATREQRTDLLINTLYELSWLDDFDKGGEPTRIIDFEDVKQALSQLPEEMRGFAPGNVREMPNTDKKRGQVMGEPSGGLTSDKLTDAEAKCAEAAPTASPATNDLLPTIKRMREVLEQVKIEQEDIHDTPVISIIDEYFFVRQLEKALSEADKVLGEL